MVLAVIALYGDRMMALAGSDNPGRLGHGNGGFGHGSRGGVSGSSGNDGGGRRGPGNGGYGQGSRGGGVHRL